MQRYYSHVIARYRNAQPIDLEAECETARQKVQAHHSSPPRSCRARSGTRSAEGARARARPAATRD
jgi:hypothetical protein